MDRIFEITGHAKRRCQERGLRRRDIARLVDLADQRIAVGKHCTSVWLTRAGLAELVSDGWPPAQLVRLTRHCVLLGEAGAVVTVLAGSRRRMRGYRRTGGRG